MFLRRMPSRSMILPYLCCCALLAAGGEPKGVRIIPQAGKLRIEINGEHFSDYHYEHVTRPFLYPVYGPEGLPMTRNWPMAEGKGEAKDHPHHRSFWYAHGSVNGYDFWSEGSGAGKTVHSEFLEIRSGIDRGLIKTKNLLVAKDGSVVATEIFKITIYNRPPTERLVDFDVTIQASHGDLVLGDTKEGSMALRLAPTLRLEGKVGKGHIVNSEGQRDFDTWGKRADWVDYYGPVKGKTVGVAIMDHPSNPRHPTWWHVRPYGLFAANPFGVHYFEKKPKGTGDFNVPAGTSVQWRYRIFFHQGDVKAARIAGRYRDYARGY